MRCHRHEDVTAMAICAGCGLALCDDCLVRGDAVCACSEACARSVERARADLGALIDRSYPVYRVSGWSLIVAGAVFSLYGLPQLIVGRAAFALFLFILGGSVIAMGVASTRAGRRR